MVFTMEEVVVSLKMFSFFYRLKGLIIFQLEFSDVEKKRREGKERGSPTTNKCAKVEGGGRWRGVGEEEKEEEERRKRGKRSILDIPKRVMFSSATCIFSIIFCFSVACIETCWICR